MQAFMVAVRRMTGAQFILAVAIVLVTGMGGGYALAIYSPYVPAPQIQYTVVYRYPVISGSPAHAFTSVEDLTTARIPGISGQTVQEAPPRLRWDEKDFQALLQWERDGIFPRIGYDRGPPDWYVAEKERRGLVVKPGPTVTEEQFADPAFRRRYNR